MFTICKITKGDVFHSCITTVRGKHNRIIMSERKRKKKEKKRGVTSSIIFEIGKWLEVKAHLKYKLFTFLHILKISRKHMKLA